jgi:transcriptional regulator with XRE-family HTH domain
VANPLGERIRTLREARGLTQAELAAAVGRKSKSTVSHWESGEVPPPSRVLPLLAVALSVTVGQLYGEEQAAPGEAA